MPPSKTPLRGSPLTQHIRLTSLAQNSLRRNFVYAEDGYTLLQKYAGYL